VTVLPRIDPVSYRLNTHRINIEHNIRIADTTSSPIWMTPSAIPNG